MTAVPRGMDNDQNHEAVAAVTSGKFERSLAGVSAGWARCRFRFSSPRQLNASSPRSPPRPCPSRGLAFFLLLSFLPSWFLCPLSPTLPTFWVTSGAPQLLSGAHTLPRTGCLGEGWSLLPAGDAPDVGEARLTWEWGSDLAALSWACSSCLQQGTRMRTSQARRDCHPALTTSCTS